MPKTIDLKIGNLTMDARSNPGDLDLKAFRYTKNARLTTKGRMCRTTGFDKAFTVASGYNNHDLHDQLLAKTGQGARKPITFLFEAISTRKTTKLIAGTDRVLFALNSGTGNWKILSDAYGTDETRWRAAQLQDIVVFSNNRDALVYWHFDQGITEAGNASVAPIPDLRDELELTRAGVVVSWKGHIFLMNVTVSGSVRSNTIYWCNYNNPLDWIPGEASTAGNADLDYGETILAALPLANRLLIYTNKGIWEGVAVGGEQTFQFSKRYAPENGESCLFYPRTLTSKGDEHVYAGEDGIYVYSLFMDKPQRPEWIHKASSVAFENINSGLCEVHVAGYDTERKELYFSYATGENTSPNETIIFNTQYPFASVNDYGVTAMTSFTHRGAENLVRDFLRDECICDDAGITTHFGDFTEEGGFCEAQDEVSCPTPPTSIYHTTTRTETYGAESVIVEDWAQASAHEDSLCAQLNGQTLADFCSNEAFVDECNSGKRFIVALSSDYCLKEISDVYYREICTDTADCGTYSRNGYKTLWRMGPISSGVSHKEKRITRFELEADHVTQVTPSIFVLRIGHHSQAVDPNNDNCGIVWDTQDNKEIECLSDDAATSATNATRPSEVYEWPLYYENSYLYFELSIENPAVSPVDTGGQCCIGRISLEIDTLERRRF